MGSVPPSFFQPPPPYSMGGYLDAVTNGRLKTIERETVYSVAARVDSALKLIDARPMAERLALRQEVVDRIAAYGDARGWLEPGKTVSDEKVLERLILEEMFGLKKEAAEDKIVAEFKKQLGTSIRAGLNSKGQSYYKFIGFINDLISAKSKEEAALILAKESTTGLGAWIARNGGVSFVVSRLKFFGISAQSRRQVLKWIALATAKAAPLLKLGSRVGKFFVKINVYVTLAELLLTPEEIVSDEVEAKLTWVFVLERARFESRQPLFDSFDKRGSLPPRDILRRLEGGPGGGSGGGASISSASAGRASGSSGLSLGRMP